MLYKA